ncbi:MAG: acyl-CoA dehydrogenase [Pseudazoarcus pumilus]|nr:acyl-CoA dehydrogenase [Pseudazoarcus pumilus]
MFWLILLLALGGVVFVLWHDATRKRLLSDPAFRVFRKAMPPMSQTERDALDAGTVWWEGDLFSGRPDWQRLLDLPWPQLSEEEQAFLDGETDELCRMIDDWNFTRRLDMSPEVWDFIRRKGFFSLIIPKEYGGKGFSAYAHSQVVTKLASRSSAPAVSVMVPNSLGPAELLIHYGTEAQKQHWLPRLAAGDEVPAFALTSPWAGSDAASIPDAGVVCWGKVGRKKVLGMRVSFDKRYITLAPVCTVFGLAFRLYDPEHLLGEREDLGITVALVPREHPGVEIGRRHLPLDAIWMNGPIRGKDVFMPLDFIIGGPERAGQGWRMLMECLAAGRSISLPAANTGTQKLTARAVGAYSRVRRQFRTPIGRFEGVEEALARIAANTWLCDAARVFTAGALDQGERPSVVSAIVKYHVTERARQTLNDGMDVIGGKGICLGPQNFLGRSYQQLPIGITVEGANILTRSLILYGQGAIRCHPHLRAEMDAVAADDSEAFHRAFSAHLRDLGRNALRALGMGLTGSHFVSVPQQVAPHTRRYYQQLSRLSAAFAVLSDACLASLGGALKRREKLSARLGDILSLLFLMSACLRRYEAEGQQAADAPLLRAALWDAMFRTQIAFEGVLANLPKRPLAWVLGRIVFPLGRPYVAASDQIGTAAAATLLEGSATRERLTQPIFVSADEDDPLAALEAALAASVATEPVEARLSQAVREGRFDAGALTSGDVDEVWQRALDAGVIDAEEHALIERRNRLRDKVIRVDDFPVDFDLRASLCEQ